MKIYVDLIILINFIFDFILILTVSLILKRNVSIKKIILSSLLGGLSIIILFIPFNNFTLFLFKVLISIIMVLTAFSFKNIKYTVNNIIYLYLVSFILGGFLYYLNNEFSYKRIGLIFFHKGVSINIVLALIISPIVLFLYVKQTKKLKNNYSKYYTVNIEFLNGKNISITGFLDSGNNLYDPYNKRPIILINKNILENYHPRCILVPCYTVNKESMINCFKIKKLVINGKVINQNVLVGISDNNFNLDGVECLLHEKIMEEIE